MADSALFVGFGLPARGRERQAIGVLNEALEYYARLEQQGEIESSETILLDPHGGDLGGFTLLRGDQAKLDHIRASEDFLRLISRAEIAVDHIGVVGAVIGERLMTQVALFSQAVDELT